MSIEKIQAIDVHAHFGKYLGKSELVNKFMSADVDVVVQRARLAHTLLTIVSPLEALMPRLSGDPAQEMFGSGVWTGMMKNTMPGAQTGTLRARLKVPSRFCEAVLMAQIACRCKQLTATINILIERL